MFAVGVIMPGMGNDMGFHIFCIHSKRSFGSPTSAITYLLRRRAAARGVARVGLRAGPELAQKLLQALLLVHDAAGVAVAVVLGRADVELERCAQAPGAA